MGFWDKITRLWNTETVTSPSQEANATTDSSKIAKANNKDKKDVSGDLKDRIPFRVNRTIPNFRYAFNYDSTVNATINNLIVVANTNFEIVAESEEFEEDAKHIRQKCIEWNMPLFIDTFIKRNMVDGSAFINRYVDKGTVKLKYLSNDGVNFKWKVIRDPDTEEILGFKQLVKKSKLPAKWKTAQFDEINVEEEEETITFMPEEIIYSTYMEENGQGVSALYSVLDLVDVVGRLQLYMLLAGHKAGAFLGLEIGNENVDSSSIDGSFIDKVMDWFSENNEKDVVAYPHGIKPEVIGTQNLPDYVTYIKFIQSQIRNAILTPDSKFSAISSNRATAVEQLNTDTGYQGFIKYLQEYVMYYVNTEIIDKELALSNPKSIGKVKLIYKNENLDDANKLAEIGTKLKNLYPDLNSELLLRTYFTKYTDAMDEYKRLYGKDWEKHLDNDMGKMDIEGSSGNLWSKPGMNSYNENLHNITVAQKKKNQEINTGKDLYKEV